MLPLNQIRLIATDMDGTLTRSGKFTPSLLQALTDLQNAGIPVVIVTGRSAGWVNAIATYLPVTAAIAENGGLFYRADKLELESIVSIPDIGQHRQKLAQMFSDLQTIVPHICESADNRFRVTDWTFDIEGLSDAEIQQLGDRCRQNGWGFTYSTVQCHILPQEQNKAAGLLQVLRQQFPDISVDSVVTVGDSPNDESLFDRGFFPHSVGVANIRHYVDRLNHKPSYITEAEEADGFCELARSIIQAISIE
ncbi:HAD family hydrolase [Leptolyngbya ohadii]|uniref:HAD family hydrolase n=1 Tax=Leptolyngbya ohadii TaxID=1962290 RepID=UPI000B59C63A|nr:HAD family hydrolase [Leptolyngbya ohadii]